MHLDNVFYGHRSILAEYCGRPETPIDGHLQHGWGAATGYSQFPPRLVPWLPRLVWSATNAREAKVALGGTVHQVGAPWVYLCDRAGVPAAPPAPSTLLFPAHGFERRPMAGAYDRLIGEVTERESGPVTACLYWYEYENPAIRRAFTDAGWRVVSNGRRHDQGFLRRFLDELRLHTRVVANRVGTPVWYGGFAGRDIEVYGPAFDLGVEGEGERWRVVERGRWPELLTGGLTGAAARELAGAELGAEVQREPAELAEIAGWTTPSRRGRRIVALADHHVRRAVVNVGMLARRPGWY